MGMSELEFTLRLILLLLWVERPIEKNFVNKNVNNFSDFQKAYKVLK